MDTAPIVSHRKIELQSPDDLRYLLDNASRAARTKIDLNFPPSAAPPDGEEDGLRRRVEELVLEYVQSTFTLAAQSITVNGLEPPSSLTQSLSQEPEEYEPYDSRLATKLQSLYATLESHSHAVAALRRDAPVQAAHAWRESFANEMDEEEAVIAGIREKIAQNGAPAASKDGLGGGSSIPEQATDANQGEAAGEGEQTLPPSATSYPLDWERLLNDEGSGLLERRAEINRTWGRSLDGLVALKGTLPGTAAKLERAKAVVEHVDGPGFSSSSLASPP
ncbi:MAG: hypothetical protein M1837_006630 [Sclerophora amabilis]|nr:MAG: hypothetical protein M1837_006630 [Sclerophora amabilis]